ncbi:MAG: hypothetical protein ABI767_06245 [Rhodanobacter sp.]
MNTSPTQQDAATLIRPARSDFKALIRRSIDLRRLYCDAAAVSEPGLRVILSDNARTLDLLIGDLQAQLRGIGLEPPTHGSWRGSTHRHLAGWLMHAAPRSGVAWIRLLGHHESALLHAFEQAIENASPEAALTLRRQLPRLQGIRLDMDSLAGTTRY